MVNAEFGTTWRERKKKKLWMAIPKPGTLSGVHTLYHSNTGHHGLVFEQLLEIWTGNAQI